MKLQRDPIESIEKADLHRFAHCIWWVMSQDDAPSDPEARSLKWQDEAGEWVSKAAEIVRHMDLNGLSVQAQAETEEQQA